MCGAADDPSTYSALGWERRAEVIQSINEKREAQKAEARKPRQKGKARTR